MLWFYCSFTVRTVPSIQPVDPMFRSNLQLIKLYLELIYNNDASCVLEYSNTA